MKRRGFIAAILGLFTFPLWGKLTNKITNKAGTKAVTTTIYPNKPDYTEADLIRKEIAMAAKAWAIENGYNPNQIHLGKKQLKAMRMYVDCTKKLDSQMNNADKFDCEMVMGMLVHSEFVIVPPYGNGPGMSKAETVEDCCRPSYDECSEKIVKFWQWDVTCRAQEKEDKRYREMCARAEAAGRKRAQVPLK